MQRAFAEALVADPEFNQTRAARAAGCGRGAEVTASKWLRLAKVQAYLRALTAVAEAAAERQTKESVASAAEVLQGLTALARGNIMDYVDAGEDGKSFSFSLAKAMADPSGVGYRIARLALDKETGAPIVELADRKRALELLARLKGMEKLAPGQQVNVQVVDLLAQLPVEQLKDMYFSSRSLDRGNGAPGDLSDDEPGWPAVSLRGGGCDETDRGAGRRRAAGIKKPCIA